MANNRVYIVCAKCAIDPEITEDFIFYLAKYYPTDGWYPTNEGLYKGLYDWMDRHHHEHSLFGYDSDGNPPFTLYFEAGKRYQDEILMKISEAVSKS